FTAAPSSSTVQAPHWLVSQPTCVPVSPSTSRRKWTRRTRGSTERVSLAPLTCRVTEFTVPPSAALVLPGGRPSIALLLRLSLRDAAISAPAAAGGLGAAQLLRDGENTPSRFRLPRPPEAVACRAR